jgi:hypothetical protein
MPWAGVQQPNTGASSRARRIVLLRIAHIVTRPIARIGRFDRLHDSVTDSVRIQRD